MAVVESPVAVDESFRAMGSECRIVIVSAAGSAAGVADAGRRTIGHVRRLESRWSRFLPDSDISRANASPGRPVPVSADTLGLVEAARRAWEMTEGRFDPTVLGAVVAAGYGESVDAAGFGSAPSPADPPAPAAGCGGIVVDRAAGTVLFPPGVSFDPGGIGKGLAADLVVAGALAAGAPAALVSLGGDLRVSGGSWTVVVEDPFDPGAAIATLHLADGGVATSSVLSRPLPGGHHTIDPARGVPTATDVVAVTVVADTGWFAEAAATAVIVSGVAGGLELVEGWGAAALVVDDGGGLHASSRLGAFL